MPDRSGRRTQTTQVPDANAPAGSQLFDFHSVQSQNPSLALTMKQNPSGIEHADLTDLLVELETRQATYEAALALTARAITPSLTDFLR